MGEDQSFLTATYLVSDGGNFYKRAEKIALGLTVGTWTGLSMEEKNRFIKHLGKVEDVKVLPKDEKGQERGLLSISFPVLNVTSNFPSLLTTIFGKGSMDGKIRLVDVDLPEGLREEFPGPKFGIEKIRNLLGVYDRPLLMSIFKQCIGLNVEELNKAYQSQLEGGVDLIKDDEIFFRDDNFPVLKRVRSFEEKNRRHYEQTGKKVLYGVNLTGPVTQMADQAKRLIDAGASCLLLNVFSYGLDVLQQLAADPTIYVPIMAHPAMAGALYPSPEYGVSSSLLFGKFLRWAGADFVLYPSPYGSVALPEEEALEIANYLRKKEGIHRDAFPVPSAGIHPGMIPLLFEDYGMDFVVNAGGGIHGHQEGSAAGGRAFQHAIDAIVSGYTLDEAANYSPELKQAIKQWGVRGR